MIYKLFKRRMFAKWSTFFKGVKWANRRSKIELEGFQEI